jgi:alpha-L-fucosidase
MKSISVTLSLLLIVSLSIAFAQETDSRYVPETDPLVLEKLEKWQDLKFGLLMHWGTYSQWGIVESWSVCAEDEGWCRRKNQDVRNRHQS